MPTTMYSTVPHMIMFSGQMILDLDQINRNIAQCKGTIAILEIRKANIAKNPNYFPEMTPQARHDENRRRMFISHQQGREAYEALPATRYEHGMEELI